MFTRTMNGFDKPVSLLGFGCMRFPTLGDGSIDKARANYYNYHTGYKWGDYKNYNLMINSSYITEEEAAELIKDYVEKRIYI